MLIPNRNYAALKDSYLFRLITEKTQAYAEKHPGIPIYRMGVGDVTLPLCPAVIRALHEAVEDQAKKETFHGYLLECGTDFLRERIAAHYAENGVSVSPDEVFISYGANDDLGALLDLFDPESPALVMEPAYPAYVEANTMAGRRILRLDAGQENGFLPMPTKGYEADLIYICSPNNPTGAAYTREQLQQWVDYANDIGAVILFDAAYEAYIEDETIPHSILELPNAERCAIEICSLSKTAGFTGMRLGYTLLSKKLIRNGVSLHSMWVRNRTAKTNGVPYIIQKGAAAVFSPEGQAQTRDQIRYYKENASLLCRALDETGYWYTGGKNAPYIWVKCPDGMDSWAFFDYLLHEAQIVVTPGVGFGTCGEGYIRLSTFADHADTAIAAQRLARVLR